MVQDKIEGSKKEPTDIENTLYNHRESDYKLFFVPRVILSELSQYSNVDIDKEKLENALNNSSINWLDDGTYSIISKILEILGIPLEAQPKNFSDNLLNFIVDIQQAVKYDKIERIGIEATIDITVQTFEFRLGDPEESGIINNSDNTGPNGSINIKIIDSKGEPRYIKITNFQGAFYGIKEVNGEDYISFKLNNVDYELTWLDTYDLFFKQLSIQPRYSNPFKILLQAFITYCKQTPENVIKSTEAYIIQEGNYVVVKNIPDMDLSTTWKYLMDFINHGASSHNGAAATFIYCLQAPLFYYLHEKTPDVKTYYLLHYGISGAGKTPLVNLFLNKGYLQSPAEYIFNNNGLNSSIRFGMAFSGKYSLPFLADDVNNELLTQHAADLKGYTETNNSVIRYDQAIKRRAIIGKRYPIITMNSDFINDNDTGVSNRFFKVLYTQKEKNKVDSETFNNLRDTLPDGFLFAIFQQIYGHISLDDLIKITRTLNSPAKWMEWGISVINEFTRKNNLKELLPLDNVETDHDTDRIYDLLNVLDSEHHKQNDQNYKFHSEYEGLFDIYSTQSKITYFITPTAYKLINRKLSIPANTLSEFLRNVNAPDIFVEPSRSTHRFKDSDNLRNPTHCYTIIKHIGEDIPDNCYKIKVLKTFSYSNTTYFAHSQYSLPESTDLPLKYVAGHFFDVIIEPDSKTNENPINNAEFENKDQAKPDVYNKIEPITEDEAHRNSDNKKFDGSKPDSQENDSETFPDSVKSEHDNKNHDNAEAKPIKFYLYRALKNFVFQEYTFTSGYWFQREEYLKELIDNGSIICLNCEQKQATDAKDTNLTQDPNVARGIKYKIHYYQVMHNYERYSDMDFVKGSDIQLESSRPIFKAGKSEIAYGLLKLRIPKKLEKTPPGWKDFLRDCTEMTSEASYDILSRGDDQ